MMKHQAPFHRSEQGAAIVITLIFLAAITLLVVSFLSSMRLENKSSASFEEAQRTKMMAQGALSVAIERLRNIPEPGDIGEYEGNEFVFKSPAPASEIEAGGNAIDYEIQTKSRPSILPAENWTINPGRLTIITPDGDEVFDLHTGEVNTTSDLEGVDLNEPVPGESVPAITWALDSNGQPNPTADRPEMRVKWQPILEDPSQPAAVDDPNTSVKDGNPMVGRYAFWIDDECAKLNYNMALGKPHSTAADVEDNLNGFVNQFDVGHWPPLFRKGWSATEFGGSRRTWALGKPQSVNYDVLFDDNDYAAYLSHDLHDHTFLHGFNRHPEALLNYIDESKLNTSGWHGGDQTAWYEGQRFNTTFYSRSPEFNVFGRSRYFLSFIPLSLEGGPMYQQPFMYNPSGETYTDRREDIISTDYILHMSTLLGRIGFHFGITDGAGQAGNADNFVTRQLMIQMYRFLARDYPGETGNLGSFIDKYGEEEVIQMCVNALWMARNATSEMPTGNLNNFTSNYGYRTTSANYAAQNGERPGNNPERYYWRYDAGNGEGAKPYLPQSGAPHLTEVLVKFWAESDGNGQFILKYRIDGEYYIHPFGPRLRLSNFPFKIDFLDFRAGTRQVELGPPYPVGTDGPLRAARNWNTTANLGALQGINGTQGRPHLPGNTNAYRKVVTGGIGQVNNNQWDVRSSGTAQKFNSGIIAVSDFHLRCGIGFSPGRQLQNGDRPLVMAPIGEDRERDTLQIPGGASLNVSTTQNLGIANALEVSFQIADPRLGIHASQWHFEGPMDTNSDGQIGTIAQPNAWDAFVPAVSSPAGHNWANGWGPGTDYVEPAETSSEKGKMRWHQRSLGHNRPDEYNTRSRVASAAYYSTIHTGMRGDPTNPALPPTPWRTINLGGAPIAGNESATGKTWEEPPGVPDYCFLDLMGNTYPLAHNQWRIEQSQPDTYSAPSYMASTFGTVNLNSKIYPENAQFEAPVRKKPLEGVFRHVPGWSDGDVGQVVDEIINYQTNNQRFDYVGEMHTAAGTSAHPSGATAQDQKEELLRNMWGCLTTKSNTFGVWGVAQSVQKTRTNTDMTQLEEGDRVTGEKRFYALVERYIWPGKDGVPGNGHIGTDGKWDRIAKNGQGDTGMGSDITTTNSQDQDTDTLFSLPGSPPLRRTGNADNGNLARRLRLARGGNSNQGGVYAQYDGPDRVGFDLLTAHSLGDINMVPGDRTSLEEAYNPPQPVVKFRVVYFKYLDE